MTSPRNPYAPMNEADSIEVLIKAAKELLDTHGVPALLVLTDYLIERIRSLRADDTKEFALSFAADAESLTDIELMHLLSQHRSVGFVDYIAVVNTDNFESDARSRYHHYVAEAYLGRFESIKESNWLFAWHNFMPTPDNFDLLIYAYKIAKHKGAWVELAQDAIEGAITGFMGLSVEKRWLVATSLYRSDRVDLWLIQQLYRLVDESDMERREGFLNLYHNPRDQVITAWIAGESAKLATV